MAATPAQRRSFGARLRELREARGWSQPQVGGFLAEHGGDAISGAAISEYERGLSAPSLKNVLALEHLFDEPAGALAGLVGYRGDDPTMLAQLADLQADVKQLKADVRLILRRLGGRGS